MKEYMYLFRGGTYPEPGTLESAEHMGEWGSWMKMLGEKGALKSGLPFQKDGKLVAADGTISDGVVEPSIGGYLHVMAESLDAAAEMAQGCPGLAMGCQVEVREMADMKM